MKLPAIAITAAFASGIALGLHPAMALHATSKQLILIPLVVACVLVLTGILLVKLRQLFFAALASLLSWILLGFLGAYVGHQPRPASHVIALVEQGHLDLKTPLRWHGQLRDEPARLPWGYGYEIELTGVEYEGALRQATGGLRLSFSPKEASESAPELHAGDEVSVLTEARRPQAFRDEGAFDRRAYLEQQNVDLVSALRAPQLIERIFSPAPTMRVTLARTRRRLRDEVDQLFARTPQMAGVLRAMLLGDRSFVDRDESTDFQKTGVFHVLVVAGLHVGALAFVLFWLGRKLKLSPLWTALLTLSLLFAYVAVVEQRPPVLRATIMAAIVVLGGFFFRRLDLLNSAAAAALVLLIANPLALRDSSFQLSFLAIGCIAGLAAQWLERTVQPYVRALRGWRDVTRDAAHEPRAAQFRIDLRLLNRWISAKLPGRFARPAGASVAGGLALAFRVWELLVVTTVLQIGMLPLMARDFHRITLSGPLANLAAVPLTGIIVPLGFLTVTTGLLFPALGKILALLLRWFLEWLVHIVQWFAHFPRWSYRIPGPPLWLIGFFFVALLLLATAIRLGPVWKRKFNWGICMAWLACAAVIAIYPFRPQWARGKLEVTVLDVGQGDSLFVVSPGGKTMLIDGGGMFAGFQGSEQHRGSDPGEEAVSPFLWSRGFQRLDLVALTHAHQDHVGGLTAILQNFRVGRLWVGREVSSLTMAKLEELARQNKIPIEHEMRGAVFSWEGVEGKILWPESTLVDIATSAKNDDSLVLQLHFGHRNFMLPGDAERQAEQGILAENDPAALQADILKIGHHGGKNSTTPEFLAAVQPQVAIISAGEMNPYGHPSPEVLERLETAGVRILRTDRDGAVHVLTDGEQVEISCFVACPGRGIAPASMQAQAPNHEQRNEKQ
jgi:competence protein ComEC